MSTAAAEGLSPTAPRCHAPPVSWYGDPDDLDRLATRLSAAAEHVRDRAAAIRSAAAAARWQGPAADAFHARVTRHAAVLGRAAGELDDAAAELHRHADRVRAEIARLIAIERAAAHALSAGMQWAEQLL